MRKNYKVGDRVHIEKSGCDVEVVKYVNSKEIYVKFDNHAGYVVKARASQLNSGKLRDPYFRGVCGVGYIGVGKYSSSDGQGGHDRAYIQWKGMIHRCYDEKTQKNRPLYIGVTVCDEWHNFQNFAEWFYSQRFEDGWHLDKDIIDRGNMVYSPDTCSMVPQEVNTLLWESEKVGGDLPVGVRKNGKGFHAQLNKFGKRVAFPTVGCKIEAGRMYIEEKEKHIKEVAEEYKGVLDERVYSALLDWTVSPTE